MLKLSRKLGEGIRIGKDIYITIEEVRGRQVRLGITAPDTIPVYREELYQAMTSANRDALIPAEMTQSVVEMFKGRR